MGSCSGILYKHVFNVALCLWATSPALNVMCPDFHLGRKSWEHLGCQQPLTITHENNGHHPPGSIMLWKGPTNDLKTVRIDHFFRPSLPRPFPLISLWCKSNICKYYYTHRLHIHSFPSGSGGKEPACNSGDLGVIPGWGRSPGEGNGPL